MSNNSLPVVAVDFELALRERYLAYALSTIMSRSLPDVRDGLKPVHRRLIYAMHQLHLDPASGFKKCARVVGDVMGKFHPHGDAAIYGALVRLAQSFSLRYPLIEGQGNFGNVDGDAAAAMRYTEARLSKVAMLLMDGLSENAVEFRPTYDGEGQEPVVFPAAFPNLLANGSTGIAVGMATSIPPHNVDEICQALILLINNPASSLVDILAVLPAPDFPTGGVLAENPETILKAYQTGRGSFRVRARWGVERGNVEGGNAERDKDGAYQVVVTEIPYNVEKSGLIEKVATLLNDKKLPLLEDIFDESTDEIRIILQPKNRNVQPEMLMEMLFRLTDFEVKIPLNINALDGQNIPRVMSLTEVLQAFLDHRFIVQKRRADHRLGQIASRLEILAGYLIAYLNLDAVIKIIREEDDPKQKLMQQFGLTANQSEAILNMRLRSLRKLQEIEIKNEHDQLEKEKLTLEQLLINPKQQAKKIRQELESLRKAFSKQTDLGRRRTTIVSAPTPIIVPLVDTQHVEDVTVVLSKKNWLRCLKGKPSLSSVVYKEGDSERFVLPTTTDSKLLIFTSSGKFYTLGVDKIPKVKGSGEPIRLLIDLADGDEIINVLVVSADNYLADKTSLILIATETGRGFVIDAKAAMAQTKLGKQVLILADGEIAGFCLPVVGDQVACVGKNRKLLIFSVTDIPILGRGKGVMMQKYKDSQLSDIITFKAEQGLFWNKLGKTTGVTDLRRWQGKRGGAGHLAPIGFPRNNQFGV